jgi:hypothetical protein
MEMTRAVPGDVVGQYGNVTRPKYPVHMFHRRPRSVRTPRLLEHRGAMFTHPRMVVDRALVGSAINLIY